MLQFQFQNKNATTANNCNKQIDYELCVNVSSLLHYTGKTMQSSSLILYLFIAYSTKQK